MRVKTTILLFTTVALTGLLAGCGQPAPTTGPAAVESRSVTATVETMRPVSLPVYAVLPGTVVPADQVQVASRLMGYVHGLKVHEGQRVEQGELLLTVDPTDVQGGINQARAGLAKAKAALDDAKANYQRFQALYQERAIPKQQFEQVEMGYKVAKSNHEAARAGLATATAQLRYADVRAPLAGIVVSKMVDNGQLAVPGHPLLVLENPDHLQVQVQVDEQAYRHLKLGQKITIQVEGMDFKSHTLDGTVERMVDAADPMTHTHTVKIGLPTGGDARSGNYAQVRIPVGERQGIVLPAAAVHRRALITGVFVLDAEGRAQFRMVRTGAQAAGGVVVLSGLVAGDRVIVHARGRLDNGVKVKLEEGGQA